MAVRLTGYVELICEGKDHPDNGLLVKFGPIDLRHSDITFPSSYNIYLADVYRMAQKKGWNAGFGFDILCPICNAKRKEQSEDV